jgi:hypothetical protein
MLHHSIPEGMATFKGQDETAVIREGVAVGVLSRKLSFGHTSPILLDPCDQRTSRIHSS